jgi:hypothetical protein
MQSPCILLVEDYTAVFYMIHKGDVPSDQCEINFSWSNSMREVEGNYFNVPALAPCLN